MLMSRYIDQILMIGDKRKFPSGIIVPAFDNVKDYFQLQDIKFKSRKEMIKDPRACELIQSEVDRLSENLSNYEKIKKVILLDEEFSQENGELTPSLKIKRRIIEKKFEKQLDKLYSTSDEGLNDN
jgi:long-chain acyl-CoA synthetase